MAKHFEKSILPYTQEQLFELVADVERYPEFVPCWLDASVRQRDGDIVLVEQVLNIAAVQHRFVSKAVMRRPASVQVTSNDGPFRQLDIHWQIEPQSSSGCTLILSTDFQLRSGMLQTLLSGFLRGETWRLLKVFENRAHVLYGHTL
ncbi:MAG: type II toxin-antitoxin system RatA family toxin [Candidatus Competibacteraceae bacterium]